MQAINVMFGYYTLIDVFFCHFLLNFVFFCFFFSQFAFSYETYYLYFIPASMAALSYFLIDLFALFLFLNYHYIAEILQTTNFNEINSLHISVFDYWFLTCYTALAAHQQFNTNYNCVPRSKA